MPKPEFFIQKELKKALLDEYLGKELQSAGYSSCEVVKTPLGTRITISALRPGLIIGRRGSRIKELSKIIEEEFGYPNPIISVVEVQVPEFDPRIMAWQVARAIARGYRYRRVGFWVLRSIMEAGAIGAEIVISGKLRTQRSRYEKFREGILLKSGEIAERLVKKAKTTVLMKQGIIGIKVLIMPPSPEYEEYLEMERAIKEKKTKKKMEVEEVGTEEAGKVEKK
ncbi:30S ribosomal protein S3 [Candidatus Geothermarchaeota archaeon]|nr:MAG: 30S ribosomal protein S3 [Candidatus Geothermarchaeota archaeon]